MTTLKRISLLLALGACLAAAGCGSDDEGGKRIPAAHGGRSRRPSSTSVQARLDNGTPGACKDILEGPRGPNRAAVQQLIDGLPDDVDPDVRDALQESFDNLWSLVESKCEDLEPDEPAQTETTEPETTPTETETEPTETDSSADRDRADHAGGDAAAARRGRRERRGDPAGRQRWRSGPRGHQGEEGEGQVSPPTEVAGRYVIERRLGAGGMSTVFMAKDTVLERPVAVKLLAEHLADDQDFVYRFRREALSAAKLQHPNIVQVFDSGQDPRASATTSSWSTWTGRRRRTCCASASSSTSTRPCELVRDACHGLDYAHRAGVVHRDVKPGNLLFAEEMGATKLADFGIAKAAEQTRITQVGSVLGTAAYLSPEQARGEEAGPASDIYSLGVCAYQFLTGRLPHEYASLTELALKQQQDPVDPVSDYRPEVPPELDDAVRLALERDPAARYSNALEMAEAIEAGARGEVTAATQRLAMTRLRRHAGDGRHLRHPGAAAHRSTRGPQPTRVHDVAPPVVAPAGRSRRDERAERDAARRAASRRRFGGFLALLAAIAAIVVVALALLSSSGGNSVQPVDTGDPQQQIDQLRDFIDEHSR